MRRIFDAHAPHPRTPGTYGAIPPTLGHIVGSDEFCGIEPPAISAWAFGRTLGELQLR